MKTKTPAKKTTLQKPSAPHQQLLKPPRSLLPFVTLALETGARFNVVRTLQWGNIDFANRSLKFSKDKTKAGSGRTVPLSPRAKITLEFWASCWNCSTGQNCALTGDRDNVEEHQ